MPNKYSRESCLSIQFKVNSTQNTQIHNVFLLKIYIVHKFKLKWVDFFHFHFQFVHLVRLEFLFSRCANSNQN